MPNTRPARAGTTAEVGRLTESTQGTPATLYVSNRPSAVDWLRMPQPSAPTQPFSLAVRQRRDVGLSAGGKP